MPKPKAENAWPLAELVALGKHVRQLRGYRSQREVAELSGIELSSVSRLERGLGNPNYQTIYSIARTFQKSVIELLSEAAARNGRPQDREKGGDSKSELLRIVDEVQRRFDDFERRSAALIGRLEMCRDLLAGDEHADSDRRNS